MAYETKVGLLAGMGFIVCFAVVLSHRGSGDQISAKMAYDVLSRQGRGTASRATTIPNAFVRPWESSTKAFPSTVIRSGQRGHDRPKNREQRPRAKSAAPTGRAAASIAAKPDVDPRKESVSNHVRKPGGRVLVGRGTAALNHQQVNGAVPAPARNANRLARSGSRSGDNPGSRPVSWESLFGAGDAVDDAAEKTAAAVVTIASKQKVAKSSGRRGGRESVRYVVDRNDTLWGVAEKAYGESSGKIVRAIYEANRDRMKSMDEISVGCELILPVMEGLPRPRIGKKTPKRPAGGIKPPAKGDGRYYDIQQGDRYATIAERFLGNKSRWREIHELNKDIFPDPGRIQYGVRIRLPLGAVGGSQ